MSRLKENTSDNKRGVRNQCGPIASNITTQAVHCLFNLPRESAVTRELIRMKRRETKREQWCRHLCTQSTTVLDSLGAAALVALRTSCVGDGVTFLA